MKKIYKGSITIFLAIIFMAFVVFTGTIVDIVRIALVEQRFENALESSTRSILADYDRDLVGEFGIMGLDTQLNINDLKNELYRYLRVNLTEGHKNINFVNCQVNPSTLKITGMGSLINQDILKKQILEYMKYRAPILMTENIVEKLKEAKLDKSLAFADNARDVRAKERQIREKVDALNGKITNITKKLNENATKELDGIYKELLDIKSLADVIYKDEDNSLEEYISQDNNLREIAEQNDFKVSDLTEFKNLASEAKEISEKTEIAIVKFESQRNVLNGIQENIDMLESQKNDVEVKIINLSTELQKIKNINEENATEIEHKIEQYNSNKEQIESQINSYQIQRDNIMNLLINDVIKKQLTGITLDMESRDTPEHEKDMEMDLNSRIDKIKEKFLVKTIDEDMLISIQEFNTVLEDNIKLDSIYETSGVLDMLNEAEGESCNDGIIGFLKHLVTALSTPVQATRDKLYTIEYILDKFTFLTSNTIRNHYFTKGEVEYILSGKDIPYENGKNIELNVITNTISKIWFLRFALDSIDIFVHSQIPHPLTRLIWSLLEGSIDASLDMLKLLNGDAVNISPSLTNIKLRYSDHLRILLLMQPEKEMLRKVQQLMQVNIKNIKTSMGLVENFRLGGCNTTINVEAEARVNLWFLPLLNIDKLGYKSIKGDQYILKKDIYIGY